MLQKWWFKIFVWFSASSFFFMGCVIVISYFNPTPSEQDIMNFMGGMMGAMHNSTMGLSMSLNSDLVINRIIDIMSNITIHLIAISIVGGMFVKARRRNFDK